MMSSRSSKCAANRIRDYFNLFLIYVLFYTLQGFIVTLRIKYYDPAIVEYTLFLPLIIFVGRFAYYLVQKFRTKIEAVEIRCLLEMFFAGNLSIFIGLLILWSALD